MKQKTGKEKAPRQKGLHIPVLVRILTIHTNTEMCFFSTKISKRSILWQKDECSLRRL